MSKLIEKAKAATVVIGYSRPRGVPEWRGTGFLISDGEAVFTCLHVVENCKKFVQEGDIQKELCCFLFWHDKGGFRSMKLPIIDITGAIAAEINSTYFGPNKTDVAYLKLDTKVWKETFPNTPIPSLEVDELMTTEVGDAVILVGFPSPLFLIAQQSGIPNALEPLVQYGKVSGILPSTNFPLPHLLALDIVGTPGSSGSPVLRVSDEEVIGIANQVLPNVWSQPVVEVTTTEEIKKELAYPIPTGISFAIPSNLFAGVADLSNGLGKFKIFSRWESKSKK